LEEDEDLEKEGNLKDHIDFDAHECGVKVNHEHAEVVYEEDYICMITELCNMRSNNLSMTLSSILPACSNMLKLLHFCQRSIH